MADQEWIKTLEDGRRVKFIYQELPEDGAFTVYKSRKAFKEEFLRVLAEPTFPPLICDSFEITAEEISKWLALQH